MARHSSTTHPPERIIGIDPGSIRCGVGIIERVGRTVHPVHWETILCGDGDFAERLRIVYDRIAELCHLHHPDRAAIEGVFYHRNANSALKLGHARGVALLALTHANLSIETFQPTEVKRAVGSYGRAEKEQVRLMVCRLLQLDEEPGLDASDALAIALAAAWRRPETELAGRTSRLQAAVDDAQSNRRPSGFQQKVREAAQRDDARRLRKRRTSS